MAMDLPNSHSQDLTYTFQPKADNPYAFMVFLNETVEITRESIPTQTFVSLSISSEYFPHLTCKARSAGILCWWVWRGPN